MKNKILSYLFGGFLAILLGFGGLGGMQVSAEKCGGQDLPSGFICCDGENIVSAGIGCEGAVVTPEKSEETTEEKTSSAGKCTNECNGIKLNTCFPIIGNCIETGDGKTSAKEAFPTMMGALAKIAMALVLIVCFIFIIIAGVIWAGAGEDTSRQKTAKDIIKKVAVTVLLLGFSGVILRLINPNFFG